jgi:hypothetical protein
MITSSATQRIHAQRHDERQGGHAIHVVASFYIALATRNLWAAALFSIELRCQLFAKSRLRFDPNYAGLR